MLRCWSKESQYDEEDGMREREGGNSRLISLGLEDLAMVFHALDLLGGLARQSLLLRGDGSVDVLVSENLTRHFCVDRDGERYREE